MSIGQDPIASFYTLGFIGGLFLLPSVEATVRFTLFPQNVVYVSSGGTARFVWDYHVDDRVNEFKSESPVWYFINQTTHSDRKIGYDDLYKSWGFVISRATCPPRLLNPDRVSRESTATLVITSVTTADNGIYRCQLELVAGSPIHHQVQLVVTVRPAFLPSHPNNIYQIIEGQDLKIDCTAIGPPTPNITWVNITDGSVKTQGSGSAVLQIDNIKRYHAGVYECQAKNNPNEAANTTRTRVTVYYSPKITYFSDDMMINEGGVIELTCSASGSPKPNITWSKEEGFLYYDKTTISKELSSTDFSSWNGRQVTLNCTVTDGLPMPNITWYNPDGQPIKTAIVRKCQVVITTQAGADYGSYKCKATNVAGSVELVIVVTQLFPPGSTNVTILDQDIQASSVTVRWIKPGYDGGSPVIDYKVQINTTNPLQEQNKAKTEHEFTGLTKNTRYEVRVYARNVVGHGNASIIYFTTKKRGPPPLPSLHLSKSETTITLYWEKPDENGGTIKNYTIYQKQGVGRTWTRIHVVSDLFNLTYVIQLEDLEPGQTYWFIVTATNEFGESEIGSSDKGKQAYVFSKVTTATTATTATQRTTTALGRESTNKSDREEKCSVTALAVCAAFLAVSLVLNILSLLYIWRNVKRKEPVGNTITKRVTRNQTVEDPVYDNTIEMKENQASSNPVSPQQTSPPGEYEPIITSRDNHPIETSSRVDGYRTTSTETPSHYQALSHPDTAGSSHQGQGPTYEPIRRPQFKEHDAHQAKNVPDTTYQPLGIRLNPTDYQSLQTYNNMHPLGNSRNDQSTI